MMQLILFIMRVGYNFRMSNIHAAIGLAQIYNLKNI